MSYESQFIQLETEYYKNGNVKSYKGKVFHQELGVKTIVKNKDFEIFKEKAAKQMTIYDLEYESALKNQQYELFYNTLDNLLNGSLNSSIDKVEFYEKPHLIKFELSIPVKPFSDEIFDSIDISKKPNLLDEKYIYKPKFYEYILFFIYFIKKNKIRKKFKDDLNKYLAKQKYITDKKNYDKKKELHLEKEKEKKLRANKYNDDIDLIFDNYESKIRVGIIEYVSLMLPEKNKKYFLEDFFDYDYEVDFQDDDNTLVVSFEFPNEDKFIKDYDFKVIKTKLEVKSKELSKNKFNNKVKSVFYTIYIAIVNDLIALDYQNYFDNIVLNGYYSGIDSRTGTEFTKCIMTSKVDVQKFKNEINIENVVPQECFKYLKGKGRPNIENIVEVEPLRFVDKEKYKLIESDNVLNNLTIDTNLAAMDWKDFETLVKDVFELEFKENNIEIKNTQHSNDGGIDVVAFNRDPYSGGTILLQAKRYTNTVSPEPVRALKGSMQDCNAIRGILITTSQFGNASYDFAKENNITLIDGQQLVSLLSKHGYDFHVNLQQAKNYNKNY